MSRKKLTNEFIENYPAPEKEQEIYDTKLKKLGIRIYPSGSRSFIYRYYNNGSKRYTIGKFPEWGIERAREEASQLYKKVQEGIDLNEEKKRIKRQNESITLKELILKFKDIRYDELSERTQELYSHHFKKLSEIHDIHLKNLTVRDVISITDEIAKEGKRRTANDVRTTTGTLLAFAESRGMIEENFIPKTDTYDEPKEKKKSKTARALSFDEIYNVWSYIKKFNEPIKTFFEILFLTGQRKTETLRMQWDHVSGKDQMWTIPASLAKNNEQHKVPLTIPVLKRLQHLKKEHSSNSKFVFQSNVKKEDAPVKTVYHQADKIRNNTSVDDFKNHCTRKTVITGMAKIGVLPHIYGRVVNHRGYAQQDTLTNTYVDHDYMQERREALKKWSNALLREIKKRELKDKIQNADDLNIDITTRENKQNNSSTEEEWSF